MSLGIVRNIVDGGAIVEINGVVRTKPMQYPKGANPAIGDKVDAVKSGGVYVITSIYGGTVNAEYEQNPEP